MTIIENIMSLAIFDKAILSTTWMMFLFTIPFFLRYYNITGSKDFLLFTTTFFIWGIHNIFVPINIIAPSASYYVMNNVTFILGQYTYFTIVTHFRWDKTPKWVMFYANLTLIVGLTYITGYALIPTLREYSLYLWLFNAIFRVYFTMMMFYILYNFRSQSHSSRIDFAKWYWVFLTSYQLVAGALDVIALISILVFGNTFIALLPYFLFTKFFCLTIHVVSAIIIVTVPEILLASNTQLLRANKLFEKIEQKNSSIQLPGELKLLKYMKEMSLVLDKNK
jgi:Tfp pilus assembly protein PilZ